MSATLRATSPFLVIVLISFTLAMVMPALFVVAIGIAVGAACIGALRAFEPNFATITRSALLAASAFSYPVFLGGRLFPWLAALATGALLMVGWLAPAQWRAQIIGAQALAIALATGLSAAAVQFFFPSSWTWVALAAVVIFLALLMTTVPGSVTHYLPSSLACAVILILSEGLLVLRQLPTHWVINGAIITLAFVAPFEERRLRMVSVSLLVALLLFGVA